MESEALEGDAEALDMNSTLGTPHCAPFKFIGDNPHDACVCLAFVITAVSERQQMQGEQSLGPDCLGSTAGMCLYDVSEQCFCSRSVRRSSSKHTKDAVEEGNITSARVPPWRPQLRDAVAPGTDAAIPCGGVHPAGTVRYSR